MTGFGNRLREARIAAGLTQEQLGFAVGVTKSSVSAWENEREAPAFKLLPILCQTLARSLDELIVGPNRGSSRSSATLSPPADSTSQARTRDELALLTRYRRLPAARRTALLQLIAGE